MVLTQEQARAMYEAMKNLNDVGATFRFSAGHVDGFLVIVEEDVESWSVNVKLNDGTVVESYENQAGFARAYGIEV
jgi:hypothetical protein